MHVVKHLFSTLALVSHLNPIFVLSPPSNAGEKGINGESPSQQLNCPVSTDVEIAIRDIHALAERLRLGISGGMIFVGGIGIYSLVSDCKDYSNGKEGEISFKCVAGAIAVMGIGTFVTESLVLRARLVDHWTSSGFTIPGINGKVKRTDIIARLESHYSERIGSEVHHLSTLPETRPEKREREADGLESQTHEVFGATFQGREVHFDDMGEVEHGRHIRVGHVPGPITPVNRRRLRARFDGPPVMFNDQFFSNGGLDVVFQTRHCPALPPAMTPQMSSNSMDLLAISNALSMNWGRNERLP